MLTRQLCLLLTQVRREDQLRINEFGRNNAQLHEIREQKKALKVGGAASFGAVQTLRGSDAY